MKRKIIFLMSVVVGLVVGCSKETAEFEPTQGKGGSNTITFNIPGASKGGITYVASVGDEDKLEHLQIYMFDEGLGTLEWVFDDDDLTIGSAGAVHTATIDVTEREGTKIFFFVGNAENITSELAASRYGETTVTQFRKMVSDVQTALPTTPLLMSGEKRIVDIKNPTPAEKTVEVSRRVARFDISNDADETNFTIKKILIGNVSRQGYIFADPSRTPVAMVSGNAPEIAFGGGTGDNKGNSEAVFYTYPTTLAETKTVISLEGDFFGQSRIYRLVPPADLDILANTRYVLKVKKIDINKIDWELTVDPWGEGQEIEAKKNDKSVTVTDPKLESGSGVTVTGRSIDMSGATGNTEFSLVASSFHKDNSRAEVTYRCGNATVFPINISHTPAVLTYGVHYAEAYKIEIPKQTIMVPVDVDIEIVSIADPRSRTKINISSQPNYPGTNLKPVLLDGVWWAPVNSGATIINKTSKTLASVGNVYQWGRNDPFNPLASPTKVQGPVTAAQFSSIPATTFVNNPVPPFHWFEDGTVPRWSESNNVGPCPAGWRIPSATEMLLVSQAFTDVIRQANISADGLSLKGDIAGQELWFPIAGYISGSSGTMASPNVSLLWAYDINEEARQAWHLRINTSGATENDKVTMSSGGGQSAGLHIRCVSAHNK